MQAREISNPLGFQFSVSLSAVTVYLMTGENEEKQEEEIKERIMNSLCYSEGSPKDVIP
jgi:hypothetical protein